jgi:transposase
MYEVRERMLLRQLVEVEGRTQSAAARELGIHRKTLQRWIATGLLNTELDVINARYGPRPPVPTRLEAVKPLSPTRLA